MPLMWILSGILMLEKKQIKVNYTLYYIYLLAFIKNINCAVIFHGQNLLLIILI